jgi:hypothetical protein
MSAVEVSLPPELRVPGRHAVCRANGPATRSATRILTVPEG